MKKQRRKAEYIDPEVQGALARRLSVHWLLFTVLACSLLVGLKWMSQPFMPVGDHLSEAWWTYGPVLLVLLCLAPVFIHDAIRLSNRFTGPMLRLRAATRQLAAGERPERITLREGDFWKDLAENFNQAVDRLYADKASAEDDQPS
ncbi:hypothetical protein Pla108_05600 [Botrimarina colliarenosi]|uniref:HAMP domain-containing protein n=1 Tax=Botrimarina colliarenosi TaxID=2528001 RepID=A0A5C6AJF6_9BACT|nr:hypothetical protein [Botrimarina colliarenosi]TWT99617.1 hypothetical protein Pla108_05600 [Botrimarina colliarenosi]